MSDTSIFQTRPMTADERRIATQLIPQTSGGGWSAVTIVIMLLLALVLYLAHGLTHVIYPPAARYVLWGSAVLVLGVAPTISAWLFVSDRRDTRRKRSEIEAELATGLVEVASIRPLDVLQLDYPPQREPDLLFRIDEKRAVALHLVDVFSMETRMPNTDFEYVRLLASKRRLGLVAHGEVIRETKHLDGQKAQIDLSTPECEPFEADWGRLALGAVKMSIMDSVLDGDATAHVADSCPPFDEAVRKFGRFLAANGRPAKIAWVFRQDLTSAKCTVWVRIPIDETNADWARRCYATGLQKGLGVKLEMLCAIGDTSFCYVWFPCDKQDAWYAMLTGLKLSVPTVLPQARAIRSGLLWKLRSAFNHHQGWEGLVWEVPERSELAFRNRLEYRSD